MDTVPTLEEYLDYVHLASGDDIRLLLANAIDITKLPTMYLEPLGQEDMIMAGRACLLAWAIMGGLEIHQELQVSPPHHLTVPQYITRAYNPCLCHGICSCCSLSLTLAWACRESIPRVDVNTL
ncbi:hypothetical protein L208DRAFT_112354 [Tricholoma matsutake]|nr:hypothetical protein L208DRAFT_112354 [Tricholoma matsutake 945]